MLYLYLDESGDLGFDFVNKKPSKFFTVSILAVNGHANNRALIYAVKKTLKRKLNHQKKSKRVVHELKGNATNLEVKKYFWNLVKDVDFSIYAMTLNKRRVYDELTRQKDRVYNFVARQVLDKIPFEEGDYQKVTFVIDKSKGKPEIEDFNSYVRRQLQGRFHPSIPLDIDHLDSQQNYGLQVCDIFCYGISSQYERKKCDWLKMFEGKIKLDEMYLT